MKFDVSAINKRSSRNFHINYENDFNFNLKNINE